MWKESYRLGIESIDRQHMKLFQMTDGLLKAIDEKAEPDVFRKAVGFLKEYVVEHFRDEEDYQASIHYDGLREHMRQHHVFTDTVLSLEKRLEEFNYDLNTVKELAGMLTAWLIYHVADADQRIAGNIRDAADEFNGSYIECFGARMQNALVKMAGMDSDDIQKEKFTASKMVDDVIVRIELTKELSGCAVFGFSKEFALKMFEAMTFVAVDEMDDLVRSALAEIANITSGNVVTLLSDRGMDCGIKTPVFIPGDFTAGSDMEVMRIVTDFGELQIAVEEI